MTTPTLEDIKAAQLSVAAMISAFEEQFKAQAQRTITVTQTQIVLQPGEHYAGIILDAGGAPEYHLVLLPGDADDVSWEDAKKFAADAGGSLPTRREQALLYSNLKIQFEERYYWSCEQLASLGDYAWNQGFHYGYQDFSYKSAELRARAVRRLAIQ